MSFTDQAQLFLDRLARRIELVPSLDYEDTHESLMLYLPDKRIYLFNIHNGTEQLWLSSPFSGGRHFFYRDPDWIDTRTGDELTKLLKQELLDHYKIFLE